MNRKSLSARFRHFFRNVRYLLKNPFTYFSIAVVLVLAVSTVKVYEAETQTDSGIATMFDSVWFTLVTIMAGYFDYTVSSTQGRIAAIFELAIGMVVLSAITGKIASVFMDMQMKRDKGLKRIKNMKGHFLLCGWRPGFEKIIDSVLASNPDITPDMMVLINEAPSEKMEELRSELRFKELNYVSGDFADENTLKRAI